MRSTRQASSMASGAGAAYYDGYGYSRPSATQFHLCLFLAAASLLGVASFCSRFERAMESLFDQLRLVIILSPLLLLLVAQYWTAARHCRSPLEQPWYVVDHRQQDGASSPWGVALALALVLLLISYQSCFQDWWFPLVNRRR